MKAYPYRAGFYAFLLIWAGLTSYAGPDKETPSEASTRILVPAEEGGKGGTQRLDVPENERQQNARAQTKSLRQADPPPSQAPASSAASSKSSSKPSEPSSEPSLGASSSRVTVAPSANQHPVLRVIDQLGKKNALWDPVTENAYLIELQGRGGFGVVYRGSLNGKSNIPLKALKVFEEGGNREKLNRLLPRLRETVERLKPLTNRTPQVIVPIEEITQMIALGDRKRYLANPQDESIRRYSVAVMPFVKNTSSQIREALTLDPDLEASEMARRVRLIHFLVTDVVRAVQALHSVDVYHGDLDLSNIVFTGLTERMEDPAHRFVAIDFDLSRRLSQTTFQEIFGKISKLPPEANMHKGLVHPSSDLTPISVDVWELLMGNSKELLQAYYEESSRGGVDPAGESRPRPPTPDELYQFAVGIHKNVHSEKNFRSWILYRFTERAKELKLPEEVTSEFLELAKFVELNQISDPEIRALQLDENELVRFDEKGRILEAGEKLITRVLPPTKRGWGNPLRAAQELFRRCLGEKGLE